MKSAVVTGGTVRLGAAIAAHLRATGWRVLTSSHRAESGADLVADLAAGDGADRLFAAAKERLGGAVPDALVNNAALFVGDGTRLEAVNYLAPKRLTELMAERTGSRGAVVNILDSRVVFPPPSTLNAQPSTAYSSTKRALLAETVRAALHFAATLRVNAVAPGPVLKPTDVHESAGKTLLGRPTPADVAEAVAFLLEANATTGAILPVDGGQGLCGRGRIP